MTWRLRAAVLTALGAVVAIASCVPSRDFGGAGDSGVEAAAPDAELDATTFDAADTSAPDGAVDAGVDQDAFSQGIDASAMVHVPEGGPVPIQLGQTQVTLTHAFKVDRYEVTVGRFRRWVDAGRPPPCGTGACDLEGTPPYAGKIRWASAWNTQLESILYDNPASCGAAQNTSNYRQPTYVLQNDLLPIVCVNWYQAVAFCAFEGKRLLTETEWEYVAEGRELARKYPWGSSAPTDCTQSIWSDNRPDWIGCGWPVPVGTATAGQSRESVHDLAGSVYEWVWDWQAPLPASATDYTGASDGGTRGTRGGSFASDPSKLLAATRDVTDPSTGYSDVGFRCASTIP